MREKYPHTIITERYRFCCFKSRGKSYFNQWISDDISWIKYGQQIKELYLLGDLAPFVILLIVDKSKAMPYMDCTCSNRYQYPSYKQYDLFIRTFNDKAYTSPQLFGQFFNFCIFIKFFIYEGIFTMVTYFLRWTLLKFFSSFPDEQSEQKVRQLDRITAQWLIHQMN